MGIYCISRVLLRTVLGNETPSSDEDWIKVFMCSRTQVTMHSNNAFVRCCPLCHCALAVALVFFLRREGAIFTKRSH
jgi:hypothetical protein